MFCFLKILLCSYIRNIIVDKMLRTYRTLRVIFGEKNNNKKNLNFNKKTVFEKINFDVFVGVNQKENNATNNYIFHQMFIFAFSIYKKNVLN